MHIAKTISTLSGVFALATLLAAPAGAADIIADWGKASPPPAPELKDVTVDSSTTALLFLDIMKQGCSARPSCVEKVPNMKRLHDQARAKNMVVWYSLVGANGKATPDDIMDPGIKPRAGEWYRQGGPDKFLGSTLQATLRQAGVKTVIICGNSFQGAAVGTASGAAQRGYNVILPVDCSSGEDEYREQYATFHLTSGGPAIITSKVTPTRSTMM